MDQELTHCTKKGADSLVENTLTAPEFICPIFLPKPKSSRCQWKKALFGVCSPWIYPNMVLDLISDTSGSDFCKKLWDAKFVLVERRLNTGLIYTNFASKNWKL